MRLRISDEALEHLGQKGGAMALDFIAPVS